MVGRIRVRVVGVDCPTCVYAIEKRLKSLACVRSFRMDVNAGVAEIEYDEGACVLRDIYGAIRDAGYDVYKEKLYFDFKGLGGEEAPALESKILRMEGVLDVRISSASGVAVVLYNPLETTKEVVAGGLRAFGAELLAGVTREVSMVERTLLYRRLGSFMMGLSVITLSTYTMLTGGAYLPSHATEAALLLMCALAVVLNYDIVVRGLKSFATATPTMDSLIAMSSVSTLIAGMTSISGLLSLHSGFHPSSFFEASAGVIGFVGLGKYLEERLRKKAFRALEDLAASLRGSVRTVYSDSVVEKPVTEVKPGEVVEVRAGEVIPVDGVVVEGLGYVDESSFTGEPVPRVKKGEGRDPVLAGSVLHSGYLRVRATRVGDETFIAYVIETVREAESLKPRLARLADRVVGYFTWAVLAVAVTTLTYWWLVHGDVRLAVMFMAAVLTVACPCALGVAIPLVTSIAVLKSSRSGVLIRSGEVFERVLSADLIVFDKTGTLTVGKPAVLAVHALGNADLQSVLHLVCTVESRGEHPLSRAIVEKCRKEGVEASSLEEYVHMLGEGVFGVVDGVNVAAGNLELASRLGVQVSERVLELINEVGSRGNTPVLVIVGSEVVAVLEVGDRLREEVPQVVSRLRGKGYRVGLASGDVEASVAYYKELLKLDFAYWGLKPGGKADLVKDLQRRGFKVAFVGDGVNDAPALSVANVGVAMGGGAEVSKEAGEVVIMNNDLKSFLFLLNFSSVVRRKMLQNLAWAFVYNVALIPLAAGAFYAPLHLFITPEVAAVAMVLSDVSVVANALSILRSSA
ncbi:MAG: cation-translocating P-type ATPase [Zestosphaera sp.]